MANGVPFQGAIDYWMGRVPTTMQKECAELLETAKDRAFIISKLTDLQMVQRVHTEIARGLTEGIGTDQIVRNLKKGKDGIPLSQLHLETVVRTNLALSYSAGRWAQIDRVKGRRPYLEYLCAIDGRERDEHKNLNGKIYPVDDPFWRVNFPPNGFNCRCDVATLSEKDIERIKERTGEDPVSKTPQGAKVEALDKNFNFIPGTPPKPDLTKYEDVYRESFLNDIAQHFGVNAAGEVRMKKYFNVGDVQDAILLHSIKPYDKKAYEKLINKYANRAVKPEGEIMMAGRLPREVREYLAKNFTKGDPSRPKFTLITIDDKQARHIFDKANPKQQLSLDEVLKIPEILKDKKSEWYWNTRDKNLLVIADRNDSEVTKIAINMKSHKETLYVVTAGNVDKSEKTKDVYKKIK